VRDQVLELSSTPQWEPLDINWDKLLQRLDEV
jgi:hypothetical protein